MKKPEPIQHGQLIANAKRPPLQGDDRWYWQVVYYENGKQQTVKGRSGRYKPREVKALLKRLNQQGGWRQTEEKKPKRKRTVKTLYAAWLTHQRKRLQLGRIKPNTLRLYENQQPSILSLGDHPLTGFRLATLQDWVDNQTIAGCAPRTIALRWRVFKMAWSWGQARGVCPQQPLPVVELPQIDGYVFNHHTPTREDAAKVRATFAAGDWAGVYFDVLLYTGGRTGESAALTWEDLHLAVDNVLRIDGKKAQPRLRLNGKTGARMVPVRSALQKTLVDWQQDREGLSVWPVSHPKSSFRYRLSTACKRAGVERFSPHGLRRLASTLLIAAKVDPKAYETLMGHRYGVGLRTYAEALGENLEVAADVLEGGVLIGQLEAADDQAERLTEALSTLNPDQINQALEILHGLQSKKKQA